MTKLTQQEIEKERESFEVWISGDYFSGMDCISGTWDKDRNCYEDYPAHLAFKSWLARAELAKGE